MSAGSDAEKKHAPGERKLREAAERGEIPRSTDLGGAAVVIAAAMAFTFGSSHMVSYISGVAYQSFSLEGGTELSIADAGLIAQQVTQSIVGALAVPLGFAAVAGLLVGLAQSQGRIATKALVVKWERLDIFANAKNIYFSSTPFVELLKGVGKVVALVSVVGFATWNRMELIPQLATASPSMIMGEITAAGWAIVASAAPLLVGLGAGDYAYSWWKSNEQLKRTDQELKDDMKQSDGDPYVRAARRRRAREIAASQGIRMVQDADVVVTNPTHYSVALRYRRGEDDAPVVLAKGVDHMAAKIRAEADRHGVPRIENRLLARGLYAIVDVGMRIPEEYYAPVAQVLALVYKKRGAKRAR